MKGNNTQAALITAALLQKYGIDLPASDLETAFAEEKTYVNQAV
jgi:hypothetical protein